MGQAKRLNLLVGDAGIEPATPAVFGMGVRREYGKLFDEGDTGEIAVEDYTSHNTTRLAFPEVQKLLLSLPEIRRGLEEARV